MNADPNKNNRRRTVKTRSRFTTLLTVYFFVALIIPNCVLANTEPYSVWTCLLYTSPSPRDTR